MHWHRQHRTLIRAAALIAVVLTLLMGALPGSTGLAGLAGAERVEAANSTAVLGTYDPSSMLLRYRQFGIEAAFAGWEPNGAADFVRTVQMIQGHGRTPLIMFDTAPMTWVPGYQAGMLLEDIVAGRYDRSLKFTADAAKANGSTILLNWGNEMEQVSAHPWSNGRPQQYVAAYRHIVELFRKAGATNVKFLWAPAGERSSLDYYPGDDVVDAIGFSMLMAEEWSQWDHNRVRPFYEPMQENYKLYWNLNKPFIVTGFALAMADQQAKADYLVEVAKSLGDYPRLCGFVYNNFDAAPTMPDFRLAPEAATAFANAYSQSQGLPGRCF